MERFEYKVLTYDTSGFMGGKVDTDVLEDWMNDLGTDGWELVSTTTTNQGQGYTRSLVLMFKRRI